MKTTTLSPELLPQNGCLLARRQLSVDRPDLPVRQSVASGTAPTVSRETESARALGDNAGGRTFIYVHLNRIIKKYDLDMIYISGPGHGGPALVANTYLEGTYSEVYPNITQDEAGLKKLFTQSPFPEEFPAMSHRNVRGRFTRGASWGIRSAMPSGPCSQSGTGRCLRYR